MDIKKILVIIFVKLSIASISYSADAKKEFYYIGGGGEPSGETTIFDHQISRVGRFTNNSDWDTTVSFNGGHTKTEALLKSKMSNARDVGPFNEKNYNALMDEIISKLRSGALKSGDQLMISIETHGARRSRGSNAEKTHHVALSNSTATELTNLTGADTVDLDKLETIIQLASDNKVKLAVMDFSCFSGNLLNIKNKNACLISASGSEQYSYAFDGLNLGFMKVPLAITFGAKFFSKLRKGKNLEDIFLTARAASMGVPDFPMISTTEGEDVNELIYNLMSPYLNYNDRASSHFKDQYETSADKFENQVCQMDANHQQLLDLLKQYEYMKPVTFELTRQEFKSLREKLEKYRSYQRQYEQSLRGKFEVEAEIKGIFENKFPNDKDSWSSYGPMDFLTVDFGSLVNHFQNLADEIKGKKDVSGMWDLTLAHLRKQKEIATYVKENLSGASKIKLKNLEDSYKQSTVTKSLASKISSEAKKVYDILYKDFRTNAPNPCRDFVL